MLTEKQIINWAQLGYDIFSKYQNLENNWFAHDYDKKNNIPIVDIPTCTRFDLIRRGKINLVTRLFYRPMLKHLNVLSSNIDQASYSIFTPGAKTKRFQNFGKDNVRLIIGLSGCTDAQFNFDNAHYRLNNKSLLIIELNTPVVVANASNEVRNMFFIDIPKNELGPDVQLYKEYQL